MSSAGIATACAAYLGITVAVFNMVHDRQAGPYMDEIFHVPQAQAYCAGNFTQWDSKITTLPGLYLVSMGVLRPVALAAGREVCDVVHLRLFNVALAVATVAVIYQIQLRLHGDKHDFDPAKALLASVNLCLLPLFYFFSFLYYTDVGSTFMVLLMYCLHLDRRDYMASLIGLIAVLFRQTNIVWVAFVAVQSAGPVLLHAAQERLAEELNRPPRFSLTPAGQLRELCEGLLVLLRDPLRLVALVRDVVCVAGGYLFVWLVFVAFLLVNEGIVVGDRSAHTAVFHPAQLLYFCLFCLAFDLPFFAAKAVVFARTVRRHYVIVVLLCLLASGVAASYTLAHPYLLADNRHFTFYIWRKVINRTEWSRFVLVPAYVFSAFCIAHSLKKTSIVFQLSFPVFVFVNLVPQLLLEFRYFIVPFMMFKLQVRPHSWTKLCLETIIYVLVNVVTIGLFMLKPFRWDHEPEAVQRFMW